jgi:nicotinate-nucleotide adenylyltransferase
VSALSDAGVGWGILGGTFNPPHLGHLRLAKSALSELGLERVLLVPARAAPHKSQEGDPGTEHRLRMCQLAAQAEPRVEVSRIELDRPGPSYTVDTLRSIEATNHEADLTLIVGADMAQTLPSWREPGEILRLARLAVAGRDGASRERAQSALASIGGEARTVFLDMPLLDISSSQVRSRVAAAEPYEDLVGAAVAGYIAEHGLYRGDTE